MKNLIRIQDFESLRKGLFNLFFNFNLLLISLLTLISFSVEGGAANKKYMHILSDSTNGVNSPKVELLSLSNANRETTFFQINVLPGDSILKINKIEWQKPDTVYNTLEAVSDILNPIGANGERIYWVLTFDFPYTQFFNPTDKLVVYTDRGTFRIPVTEAGRMKEEIKELSQSKNNLLLQVEQDSKQIEQYIRLWIVFLIVSIVMTIGLIIFLIGFLLTKKNRRIESNKYREQLEVISHQNLLLEKLNDKLYQSKFSTFNALCNEFYEKSGSDNMKISFYNNIKNYIFTYTDKTKIEELQEYVDTYQENIISRIKEQLFDLPNADIVIITYILCGFSPKTISVLNDINVKQYYYRRNKIKEQILASDAPEKEFFASKI